jgi:hypothetical protein
VVGFGIFQTLASYLSTQTDPTFTESGAQPEGAWEQGL